MIWRSDEIVVEEEGCLSLPEQFGEVARAEQVRVRFLDRAGAPQEIEGRGLLARCLQHEIDHLDGVLFVDHLSALKRTLILRKLQKAKRATQPRQRLSPCPDVRTAIRKPRCRRPPRRLVFMGTAAFAVPSLEALAASRHELVAVYTPAGAPGRARLARAPLAGAGRGRGAGDPGARAGDACAIPRLRRRSRRSTPISPWSPPTA